MPILLVEMGSDFLPRLAFILGQKDEVAEIVGMCHHAWPKPLLLLLRINLYLSYGILPE
jgi:hypothetical protein